jgi:hypothetical protein
MAPIKIKSSSKKTRLHNLIMQQQWCEVVKRVKTHPGETKNWVLAPLQISGRDDETHKSRVLPLHTAITYGAPYNVINTLIEANVKALSHTDSYYDRYPLHFACLHCPQLDIIQLVTQKYPPALKHQDSFCRTPLHYASFGKALPPTFDFLLKEYPEAAEVGEIHGWTPLHVAVKMGCSYNILKLLVEIYPMGLGGRTKKGATVVHIARNFHGPDSTMEAQLYALQSALDAVYDLERGRLSLGTVADALCEEDERRVRTMACQLNESIATISTASDESELSDEQSMDGDTQERDSADVRSSLAVDEPIEESQCCVICMESKRTHAFVPCGHMCVCQSCAHLPSLRDSQNGKRCPVCRRQSFIVMKVYS